LYELLGLNTLVRNLANDLNDNPNLQTIPLRVCCCGCFPGSMSRCARTVFRCAAASTRRLF
jgi:hypothetical protein